MINSKDIELAKAGNSDAFGRLYKETVKTAYFVAKRILVNYSEDEIEDLLQDAYVSVYRNLGSYSTGNFQGWVDVIVANRAKNLLKKKKVTLFSELESEEDDAAEFQLEDTSIEFRPDERVDYTETKRLVMEMIDNLSEEQRMAVILYYFENLGVKEIAGICECSENTIKSRLNYARKSIKLQVEDLEKKGTKLYSVSLPLIPFLIWLLRQECRDTVVSDNLFAAGAGNVASAVNEGIGKATADTVNEGIGKAAADTVNEGIGKVAAGTVKTGMSVATKAVIGVVAAAVIGGGIFGGISLANQNKQGASSNQQQSSQMTGTVTNEEKPSFSVEEIIESPAQNFNFSYIQIKNWDNSNADKWNKILHVDTTLDGLEFKNVKTEVLTESVDMLSVKITIQEHYKGAMHPSTGYLFYNINMETGEECDVRDFVDIEDYCSKVAAGKYSNTLNVANKDALEEIFRLNSSAITGKSGTANKIRAIIDYYIDNNMLSWGIKDGQVQMYFLVSHAMGDSMGIIQESD